MKGSTLDLAERFSVKAKSSENAPVGRFPWNATVWRSAADVPTGTPAVDLADSLCTLSRKRSLFRGGGRFVRVKCVKMDGASAF